MAALVLFGGGGDLAMRMLLPSLYFLEHDGLLPDGLKIIGAARSEESREEYIGKVRQSVEAKARADDAWSDAAWARLEARLDYLAVDATSVESLRPLKDKVGDGACVSFLAVSPSLYARIVTAMRAAGLAEAEDRVVLEKPVGRDLETFRQIDDAVADAFSEHQVFRIDHYLGKETVQNILVFRFANGIFEPLWNRNFIDHVQITVAESIGVEDRGGYYDSSGATRDMIQNHLTQLLTLTAMEPPVSYDADAVRDEKVKALRAIRPIAPHEVDRYTVRGQYGPGSVSGRPIPGYREERGVAAASQTETFVALKLFIESWRWAGVPFYLRSGKAMPRRVSEIAIQFKTVPTMLFADTPMNDIEPNVLAIKIQPDEGITLKFGSKVPGQAQIRPVTMDFRYGTSFGVASPEAYERLLLDCMLGDSTLFTRRDEVEASWGLITPILQAWAQGPAQPFPNYEAGTWGPSAADEFLASDGRAWRRL